MAIAEEIKKKGADFEVLNINLDTKSPTGQLMLTLLAAIAEFEKGIMLERQREGIAIAKEDGKYKGRKPTEKTKLLQVQTLIESGISISKAVSEVGTADALITKRLQKVAFSFYFSLATFFSETLLRPQEQLRDSIALNIHSLVNNTQ